ncbi:hypothetical protein CNMCM8927_000229 [Aspergillus lentulus]|uniref:PNPLA domain-containing protein n=1 Tax=Aspergillus lentulus TaxID=293939 RepID=A0AAN5YIZ8_ASPLE|nr:hypothetical protein CNMCM8927_000229 [Aspergillus lentulus]
MGWDVPTYSQVFDCLARQVFWERRQPVISWLLQLIIGRDSILGDILRWLSWLLYDSCYDTYVFNTCLCEAFHDERRIFSAISQGPELHSQSKFSVVAASIAKETRAKSAEQEPPLWKVARATAAAPFYFSTADLRGIGSFQDGGLQDNFAANIARRISRRIWPTKHGVARLILMGTGISDNSCNHSLHYRHVFRDSFLRRGFDALMSNLDMQSKWLQMIDQLDNQVKLDYIRLNVPLKDIPCTIDNADAMDDYQNLVTLQLGSARMARKAATALLVARFYFVLDRLPEEIPTRTHYWYQGSIHCKGPTKPILEALNKLHLDGLEFITDRGTLGGFHSLEDICLSCQQYRKPVSILVHHPNETLDIHMRINCHEQ